MHIYMYIYTQSRQWITDAWLNNGDTINKARQHNTTTWDGSLFLLFKEKVSCLRWDSNPHHCLPNIALRFTVYMYTHKNNMDLHTVIYVYTLYMYACTHVHMYMLRTDLKPWAQRWIGAFTCTWCVRLHARMCYIYFRLCTAPVHVKCTSKQEQMRVITSVWPAKEQQCAFL